MVVYYHIVEVIVLIKYMCMLGAYALSIMFACIVEYVLMVALMCRWLHTRYNGTASSAKHLTLRWAIAWTALLEYSTSPTTQGTNCCQLSRYAITSSARTLHWYIMFINKYSHVPTAQPYQLLYSSPGYNIEQLAKQGRKYVELPYAVKGMVWR